MRYVNDVLNAMELNLIHVVFLQAKGLPGIIHVTSVATLICGLLAFGKFVIYKHTGSKAMCLECK